MPPRPASNQRCKRTGGQNWHCSERAIQGRAYCEKHFIQQKIRNQRRNDKIKAMNPRDSDDDGYEFETTGPVAKGADVKKKKKTSKKVKIRFETDDDVNWCGEGLSRYGRKRKRRKEYGEDAEEVSETEHLNKRTARDRDKAGVLNGIEGGDWGSGEDERNVGDEAREFGKGLKTPGGREGWISTGSKKLLDGIRKTQEQIALSGGKGWSFGVGIRDSGKEWRKMNREPRNHSSKRSQKVENGVAEMGLSEKKSLMEGKDWESDEGTRYSEDGCSLSSEEQRNSGNSRERNERNGDAQIGMLDITGKEEKKSTACHQCRKKKKAVVFCSNCKRTCCCFPCLAKWYPEQTKEEFEIACPVCCGNCNCKSCLPNAVVMTRRQEADANVKLQRLLYLLKRILPLLRQIHAEQNVEISIEAKIQGIQSSQVNVIRSKLGKDERRYCDNCYMSIINFHRSCPSCSFDLCLTCCHELREGWKPESNVVKSAPMQLIESKVGIVGAVVSKECFGYESHVTHGTGGSFSNGNSSRDWRANSDGSIRCPPAKHGGCSNQLLKLQRNFKANWVAKLLKNAEELTGSFEISDVCYSQGCSLCSPNVSSAANERYNCGVRQAAFRENSNDNFLYCPNALDMRDDELEHFQIHWARGEPVIVRDVHEKTSGLSWEPMVIWRAVKDACRKKRKEGETVKAIDCLDWREVEISIPQFFKGYLEGRMHMNGWPEMLKLIDWPSSSLIGECLPRHGAEFVAALPFYDYTHPKYGLLNLAAKLPEGCLKPELGPKVDIAYGCSKELGRGDSVTKLHCGMYDVVNVLAHTTEVKLTSWQRACIRKLRKAKDFLEQDEVINEDLSEAVEIKMTGPDECVKTVEHAQFAHRSEGKLPADIRKNGEQANGRNFGEMQFITSKQGTSFIKSSDSLELVDLDKASQCGKKITSVYPKSEHTVEHSLPSSKFMHAERNEEHKQQLLLEQPGSSKFERVFSKAKPLSAEVKLAKQSLEGQSHVIKESCFLQCGDNLLFEKMDTEVGQPAKDQTEVNASSSNFKKHAGNDFSLESCGQEMNMLDRKSLLLDKMDVFAEGPDKQQSVVNTNTSICKKVAGNYSLLERQGANVSLFSSNCLLLDKMDTVVQQPDKHQIASVCKEVAVSNSLPESQELKINVLDDRVLLTDKTDMVFKKDDKNQIQVNKSTLICEELTKDDSWKKFQKFDNNISDRKSLLTGEIDTVVNQTNKHRLEVQMNSLFSKEVTTKKSLQESDNHQVNMLNGNSSFLKKRDTFVEELHKHQSEVTASTSICKDVARKDSFPKSQNLEMNVLAWNTKFLEKMDIVSEQPNGPGIEVNRSSLICKRVGKNDSLAEGRDSHIDLLLRNSLLLERKNIDAEQTNEPKADVDSSSIPKEVGGNKLLMQGQNGDSSMSGREHEVKQADSNECPNIINWKLPPEDYLNPKTEKPCRWNLSDGKIDGHVHAVERESILPACLRTEMKTLDGEQLETNESNFSGSHDIAHKNTSSDEVHSSSNGCVVLKRLNEVDRKYEATADSKSCNPEDTPPDEAEKNATANVSKYSFPRGKGSTVTCFEESDLMAAHGGAVWDVFRRQDVPKLIDYLQKHWKEFNQDDSLAVNSVTHPIHYQTVFLNGRHKKQLKEEYDVEPWTFEQYLGEAVFIPAGCARQVRNKQSCIKVALDFVSPESIRHCIRLSEEFRSLPKSHGSKDDRLEPKKMALYAASKAIREAKDLIQQHNDGYKAHPSSHRFHHS